MASKIKRIDNQSITCTDDMQCEEDIEQTLTAQLTRMFRRRRLCVGEKCNKQKCNDMESQEDSELKFTQMFKRRRLSVGGRRTILNKLKNSKMLEMEKLELTGVSKSLNKPESFKTYLQLSGNDYYEPNDCNEKNVSYV